MRERFHKTELQSDEEFQTAKDLFISELYTYLMGQAHRAMHDAFVEAETLIEKGPSALPTASRAASIRSGVAAMLVTALTGGCDCVPV